MDKMSFAGRGTLNAGTYGEIEFSGSGKVAGDIVCTGLDASGSVNCEGNVDCSGSVETSGSFHCQGNLKAKSLDSSGSCQIDGNVDVADNLDCSGAVHIGGDFSGGQLDCSGSVKVGGSILRGSVDASGSLSVGKNVKGKTVDISGRVEIGTDCEVESFSSSGMILIAGLLNADEIEIRLGSRESRVGEIGGDHIVVKCGDPSSWGGLFRKNRNDGILITESIEGNEISLENTQVKSVRGSNIRIGSNCTIDMIEYSGTCVVDANSKVGEKIQV